MFPHCLLLLIILLSIVAPNCGLIQAQQSFSMRFINQNKVQSLSSIMYTSCFQATSKSMWIILFSHYSKNMEVVCIRDLIVVLVVASCEEESTFSSTRTVHKDELDVRFNRSKLEASPFLDRMVDFVPVSRSILMEDL